METIVRSEINQRTENQDSSLVLDLLVGQHKVKLLAVADGMGGHMYGKEMSQEALEKLSVSLFQALCVKPAIEARGDAPVDIDSLKQALSDAITLAHARIDRIERANTCKAGTTLVVALLFEDGLTVVGNVGDSPLFHYSVGDRTLREVTINHSFAGALVRCGRISRMESLSHHGRHILEFHLGGKLPRTIPISVLKRDPGDMLLLCSDGITCLSPSRIQEILEGQGKSLECMAQGLLDSAVEDGETDNQTLILAR